MSALVVRPAYTEPAPVSRALKGLAKVHDLPPYEALYGAHRAAVVVVASTDAEAWRAALGAGPFVEGQSTVFWLGAQIELRCY